MSDCLSLQLVLVTWFTYSCSRPCQQHLPVWSCVLVTPLFSEMSYVILWSLLLYDHASQSETVVARFYWRTASSVEQSWGVISDTAFSFCWWVFLSCWWFWAEVSIASFPGPKRRRRKGLVSAWDGQRGGYLHDHKLIANSYLHAMKLMIRWYSY